MTLVPAAIGFLPADKLNGNLDVHAVTASLDRSYARMCDAAKPHLKMAPSYVHCAVHVGDEFLPLRIALIDGASVQPALACVPCHGQFPDDRRFDSDHIETAIALIQGSDVIELGEHTGIGLLICGPQSFLLTTLYALPGQVIGDAASRINGMIHDLGETPGTGALAIIGTRTHHTTFSVA